MIRVHMTDEQRRMEILRQTLKIEHAEYLRRTGGSKRGVYWGAMKKRIAARLERGQ